MAELELVGFDSIGKELEAPQGSDTYVAKKAVKFEQPVTTDSTIDGRDVAADGTKLDLLTVTQAVDLDTLETRVNALDASVVLMGTWSPNDPTFPVSTKAGESWICNGTGVKDSIQFRNGDRILAIVDGASPVIYANNWLILDYTDQVSSVAGRIGAVTLTESDITDLQAYLLAANIDTLGKLNAILTDANVGDAGDFATAAQGAKADTALQPGYAPTAYLGQNIQTGASYTLQLSDAGKIIDMGHGSANSVVIPDNTAVPFPVNTRIDIVQSGVGLTTVTILIDTLYGAPVSFGQYRSLSLWKKSATVWLVLGGTTP